ncbi:MAG: hypothetical protein AMXMBFR33_30530 [Candidatus Xenobia bacterium]|jgi:hypothetical protein
MAELKAKLDYQRIAEAINVILTDIYGEYVAMGSPTKLGGLRFLDVESSKTFAFEKTRAVPEEEGNYLIVSAPVKDDAEVLEATLKKGPHGKALKEFAVRSSSDAGKGGKKFVEVAYFLPTGSWLSDKTVADYAKKHSLINGNDVVTWILRDQVLPLAREVMANFVAVIRNEK